MNKLISKRITPIIWDNKISLKVTLTSELSDIGIDPKKDDLEKAIIVSLYDDKKIVIEKVE